MKKILTLIFAMAFVLALNSCGGATSIESTQEAEATEEEVESAAEEMVEEAKEIESDSTATEESKEAAEGETAEENTAN